MKGERWNEGPFCMFHLSVLLKLKPWINLLFGYMHRDTILELYSFMKQNTAHFSCLYIPLS
jgi:hypothetical protein